jgi:hypothetical protein
MLSYIYSWIYPTKTPITPVTPKKETLATTIKVTPTITIQTDYKTHLSNIIGASLKKATVNTKQTEYEPRHPVLKELLSKIPKAI